MRCILKTTASATLLGIFAMGGVAHAEPPVVAPPVAAPAPPPFCTSNIDSRQFASGFVLGQRIVQQAVARVADCDQIDLVTNIVLDNVSRLILPPNPSNAIACRFTGTIDGVLLELDNQNLICADECTADGEFFGKLTSDAYCALSVALDGLVSPNPFERNFVNSCGFNYEVACDSAYISNSLSYEGGICVEYTEGVFESVWDQSRFNSCAYDPIIPDS